MRDRVRVLCRPAVAAGFRLAGLEPAEAEEGREGARRLSALLGEQDAGVILVQEDFYAALSDSDCRALARQPLPLVVPFPGPVWVPEPAGADAFVAELLRQAIGYRVRLG